MKYDFENVFKRYNTGSSKWNEMAKYGLDETQDIIPFSVADMEFLTASEIVEALKKELDTSILGYANATPKYFETVCKWFENRHDWKAKSEWIIPSHGVVDAFFTAVRAFTNEGDGVILNTPVYHPMYWAVKNQNRKLIENHLINNGGHYEIDFEDLEKKASDPETKLLILCSPHNPCGRVWTREELNKIGEICLKHGVLVLSDEIHCDLIMPGHKHTVFASINEDFANHCVVCTAPSKTFNIAGLQTSNIFIPNPKIREKFLNELHLSPQCNILGYRAAEAAYKNCGEWLDEVLKIIERNKNLISDFMAREFPEVKVTPLEGTYLLWLDFRCFGLSREELEKRNREKAKLFFDEGYIFGAAGEGFERWNIACPTRYIQEALERLKKAIRS
ncbi:MAG: pyridoxal phosphate-dependent aminotransferase [Synergistaceae bacterium]|nr:pyridoxal phosphate-dependent aminotransferase [Synergistaceae bacterium]